MILLGLSGKAGSGKNTVAQMIATLSRGFVHEAAFADSLKDEVAVAIGVERHAMDEQKERFRPIWQWWGTEFRRFDDNEYWIRKLGNKIAGSHFKPDVAIITDCRFKNEFDFVKSCDGFMIRVSRPWPSTAPSHSSETELDEIKHDSIIMNYGSLDDLRKEVVQLCRTYSIPLK